MIIISGYSGEYLTRHIRRLYLYFPKHKLYYLYLLSISVRYYTCVRREKKKRKRKGKTFRNEKQNIVD